MNKSVLLLTRTAILLALALLFQSLRLLPIPANISQYLIGSLINLTLIVAALFTGLKGGLAVALLTPVVALLQGFIPHPVLVPLIAAGNAVLVIVVALFHDKKPVLSLAAGSLLKFAVLYLGIVQAALPLLLTELPLQRRNMLAVSFSWPQLITAVMGSIIALAIIPLLQRAVREKY